MKNLKKLSVGWALVVGMAIGAGAAIASTGNSVQPAANPNGCTNECAKNVDCDAVCGAGFGVCSWRFDCRWCICSG